MKKREIRAESRQSEANSSTCLISSVFLGRRSVVQVVSKTRGLAYFDKTLFKLNIGKQELEHPQGLTTGIHRWAL